MGSARRVIAITRRLSLGGGGQRWQRPDHLGRALELEVLAALRILPLDPDLPVDGVGKRGLAIVLPTYTRAAAVFRCHGHSPAPSGGTAESTTDPAWNATPRQAERTHAAARARSMVAVRKCSMVAGAGVSRLSGRCTAGAVGLRVIQCPPARSARL